MNDDTSTSVQAGDRLWPRLIVAGMVVVVMVNFAFIWIAVSGADQVVPSYVEEER